MRIANKLNILVLAVKGCVLQLLLILSHVLVKLETSDRHHRHSFLESLLIFMELLRPRSGLVFMNQVVSCLVA